MPYAREGTDAGVGAAGRLPLHGRGPVGDGRRPGASGADPARPAGRRRRSASGRRPRPRPCRRGRRAGRPDRGASRRTTSFGRDGPARRGRAAGLGRGSRRACSSSASCCEQGRAICWSRPGRWCCSGIPGARLLLAGFGDLRTALEAQIARPRGHGRRLDLGQRPARARRGRRGDARRRRPGDAEHLPGGVRDGRRRGRGLRGAAGLGRSLRACGRSRGALAEAVARARRAAARFAVGRRARSRRSPSASTAGWRCRAGARARSGRRWRRGCTSSGAGSGSREGVIAASRGELDELPRRSD